MSKCFVCTCEDVTVDDVRMPQPPKRDDRREDADDRGEGAGY